MNIPCYDDEKFIDSVYEFSWLIPTFKLIHKGVVSTSREKRAKLLDKAKVVSLAGRLAKSYGARLLCDDGGIKS